MGCFDSKNEPIEKLKLKMKESKWVDSPVGKLILRINNIYLDKLQNKDVLRSHILLKTKLSNQESQIKLEEIGKNKKKIEFAINSCYKSLGRFLMIEVWNLKGDQEKDVGFGFFNLNQMIGIKSADQKQVKKVLKSFINYSNQPGGYIQFQAQFIPFQYEELTIKINSAFLQRNVQGQTFTAKIIIGEEIIQTKPITVIKGNQLKWAEEVLTFRVPSFLECGRLQIVEKKGSSDVFWGEYPLDVKHFINAKKYRQIEVDDELQNEKRVSGRIRLSSMKGSKDLVTFRQIDSPKRKSKIEETSLKIIDGPTFASHNEVNGDTARWQGEGFDFDVYKNRRANSLPPLDISIALKKLQIKRKRESKET